VQIQTSAASNKRCFKQALKCRVQMQDHAKELTWLTDKSSKLLRQCRAEQGIAGVNPVVVRSARYDWV
jgi:hypothetical protein